mmetsp:Transcript_7445/g.27339  ORF Transcript_7445/g.27339 Transcript_7445/m.27339 type:complete len:268 (-) Transcript_7445:235-1038(-)
MAMLSSISTSSARVTTLCSKASSESPLATVVSPVSIKLAPVLALMLVIVSTELLVVPLESAPDFLARTVLSRALYRCSEPWRRHFFPVQTAIVAFACVGLVVASTATAGETLAELPLSLASARACSRMEGSAAIPAALDFKSLLASFCRASLYACALSCFPSLFRFFFLPQSESEDEEDEELPHIHSACCFKSVFISATSFANADNSSCECDVCGASLSCSTTRLAISCDRRSARRSAAFCCFFACFFLPQKTSRPPGCALARRAPP